ncbi:MAG TPA: YbaB/EbfC family nucleoid-associated protein [Micromonosporaceae bacterium]|jgi:DNA-binding protein YbaB|nr:YbaB/EbfC family nucleoid-associated protein [Micromonosporaceae bacterium]
MAREIDEAWVEEAIERYRRIEALQADFDKALHGVEVTVRSPDGLVEVIVSAGGAIRAVTIVGSLQDRTNLDVSRSIQAAVAAAHDAAGWARQKLHADTFGDYRPLRELR